MKSPRNCQVVDDCRRDGAYEWLSACLRGFTRAVRFGGRSRHCPPRNQSHEVRARYAGARAVETHAVNTHQAVGRGTRDRDLVNALEPQWFGQAKHDGLRGCVVHRFAHAGDLARSGLTSTGAALRDDPIVTDILMPAELSGRLNQRTRFVGCDWRP